MTSETDNRQRPAIGASKKPVTGGFVFAVVLWAHVFVLAWLLVLGHIEGAAAFWFLIGCLVLALPTTTVVWFSSLPASKQEEAQRKRAERLARKGSQ